MQITFCQHRCASPCISYPLAYHTSGLISSLVRFFCFSRPVFRIYIIIVCHHIEHRRHSLFIQWWRRHIVAGRRSRQRLLVHLHHGQWRLGRRHRAHRIAIHSAEDSSAQFCCGFIETAGSEYVCD